MAAVKSNSDKTGALNGKILCERRHPDYQNKLSHWDFLLSTYESSRDWFGKNIFKFVREGADTYAGRLERAYRFNHTREIVDLVNKYLFKVEPLRAEDVPDYVKRFRKRATMSGLSLNAFERQVARASSIFGRAYVVIDNNKVDDQASVADEKKGDARLYAYIVQPEDFLDCGYDENGHFEWVLLREMARDDNNPFSSSGCSVERFRLWTKNNWYLFEKRERARKDPVFDFVDDGAHDLGIVPVVKADHIESDRRYSVPALIEDIAYLDRAVANYLSNLDQIINDQTFSQLVMPAQGILSGVSTTDDPMADDSPEAVKIRRMMLRMGTSQVLLYDGEHGEPPAYISPDPRQAQLIITTIKQIINEIYHTVGLAGERTKQDNSAGIDNSSGVAKAFDFERVNALLSSKANAMQNFSNRVEAVVRAWNGDLDDPNEESEPSVLYSTEFDVRGLADELTIALELGNISAPIELRREHMKALYRKLWPMATTNEQKKMDAAIANWQDAMYLSPNPGIAGEKPNSAQGGDAAATDKGNLVVQKDGNAKPPGH